MLNPNYSKTITLYNCLKGADNPDGNTDVWYRTDVDECFFKNVMSAVHSGTSSQMTGTYTSRIPSSSKYMPYAQWCGLSASSRRMYFTGNLGDIIVSGNCHDIISNESPNTSAQVLNRNKPNAFQVTAFSDNSAAVETHYRYGG